MYVLVVADDPSVGIAIKVRPENAYWFKYDQCDDDAGGDMIDRHHER